MTLPPHDLGSLDAGDEILPAPLDLEAMADRIAVMPRVVDDRDWYEFIPEPIPPELVA